MKILVELFEFLKYRKKLWMSPIVTLLIVIGGLVVVAQGSIFAPFIYTIF